MLTPTVKATLFAPTPINPTPTIESRSLLSGRPLGSRSAARPRSRSPAKVKRIATKGSGGPRRRLP